MVHKITSKADALRHIKATYPIGQSPETDDIILRTIDQYGVENLPTELIVHITGELLNYEDEAFEIEIKEPALISAREQKLSDELALLKIHAEGLQTRLDAAEKAIEQRDAKHLRDSAREKLLVEALKEAKAYLVIHHDETEALLVIQQAEEALQQYAGEGGEKA